MILQKWFKPSVIDCLLNKNNVCIEGAKLKMHFVSIIWSQLFVFFQHLIQKLCLKNT